MPQFFLKLLNMSISASWVVLAVLLLRFAMKKAPKWTTCALWAMVAVRLVIPFSIESVFSLIPSTETLPQQIITGNRFEIDSGIPIINQQINDGILDHYYEGVTVPVDHGLNTLRIASLIWLVGIALLLVYAMFSYLRLKGQVSACVKLKGNIYLCDYIESPFILGILRPRIYLPSSLEERSWPHVLAHENAHLSRKDHWWKPLGFALLCIHWFNPVMWLAYVLLCKDIELACDEKVINQLGECEKKSYSQALLQCSVPRHLIAACPLAFGEVGVKERVKSVLNYKKPAFWILLVALIVCVAVAVCFLTDPMSAEEPTPTIHPPTTEPSDTNNTPPATDNSSKFCFYATVLEVSDSAILVEPLPGSPDDPGIDRIWVSLSANSAEAFESGNIVQILYDGIIAESYPGQISRVYEIQVLEDQLDEPKEPICPVPLSMELLNLTAEGADVRYTVNAESVDAVWTNYDFWLEVFTEDGWVRAPGYDPNTLAWETACIFYSDESKQFTHLQTGVSWYRVTDAPLAPGQYRFCKDVYYNLDGQTHYQTCYTEFEILPYSLRFEIKEWDGITNLVLHHQLTGKAEMWANKDFTLEHLEEGQWIQIAPKSQESDSLWFKAFNKGITDTKWSRLTHQLDLSELTDQVCEPGLYRICVPIYITAGDDDDQTSYVETVSAQFAIYPEEIPSYRSVNEAILDGCVTMVNNDIVAGQHAWQNFVETTSKGHSATIRLFDYISFSYPANYDPNTLQDAFAQSPVVIVYDLVYDGHQYYLYSYQDGKGLLFQYPYLLHYTGGPEDQYANYDSFDRYVLSNHNTMTWEELQNHMAVSFTNVRQFWLVTDLIYDYEPTLEHLEAVRNQLNDFWVEYEIVYMDVNELTGKLDIGVARWVDGIDDLIERYIPLRCVTIFPMEYTTIA